ncbi:hypothetical protein ACWHA3_21005 [Streptomyces cyaneofuscatus]
MIGAEMVGRAVARRAAPAGAAVLPAESRICATRAYVPAARPPPATATRHRLLPIPPKQGMGEGLADENTAPHRRRAW